MCFNSCGVCALGGSDAALCGPLQVTWNTSPSWSPGACWRCWSTSTSGRGRRPSALPTSCFPCWSWCPRREPRPPSACATPGLPSSGDLQPLHLLPLPSPVPTLSRDCNRSLSSLGISDEYLFLYLFCFTFFFVLFIMELMLLCTFALYVTVLLLAWRRGESSRFIFFCGHVFPNCCSPFTRFNKAKKKKPHRCTASDSSLFVTLLH